MPLEQSILVKRKASEAPLDLLCVDDDQATPSDGSRKRRHVFRRIPTTAVDSPPAVVVPPAAPFLAPSAAAHAAWAPKRVRSASSLRGRSPMRRPPREPRRFRMLKERISSSILGPGPTSAAFSARTSTAAAVGRKRKAGPASTLVVFEEQRGSKKVRPTAVPQRLRPPMIQEPEPVSPVRDGANGTDPAAGAPAASAVPLRARKRPNASPAERLWRQASWSSLPRRSRDASPLPGVRNMRDPLGDEEAEALRLAVELQSFALEEIERTEERNAALAANATTTTTRAPRSPWSAAATPGTRDGSGAEESDEDDGVFVYDRYVRCSTPPTAEEEARAQQLGLAVIGRDDEPAWTAYLDEIPGEDPDSASELEDDEDSNAEDYYTNDYPDEEPEWSSRGSSPFSRPDSDYDLNDPAEDVGFGHRES